ncbi:MAG TPA: hypothetical protein VFO65_06440 [Acidimicrobiales bacterium]|nr:hypothetical protein [Acidimicrobiales bacterium]
MHLNAAQLALAGPIVSQVAAAFSGAAANSQGLGTGITNEMNLGVSPANADREAYGRGTGLEVGLLENAPNNPDSNALNLAGRAEAGATPLEATGNPAPLVPGVQTGVANREIGPVQLNPVAYASVLRGRALATWNENWVMPMVGSPLGFGLGYADSVQLLNLGAAPATPTAPLGAPLVALDSSAAGPERTTSQSFSLTYLINNGDGTCGLASETHITVAPVRINLANAIPQDDITIEVLGEFVLKASATGKPGGGKIEYKPTGATADPQAPILRIIQNNIVTNLLTTQQLFGNLGLNLPVALQQILDVSLGEDPRAIAAPGAIPDENSSATVTDTEVSGAVDVLRLGVLNQLLPGITALDLRLGHMESKVSVPAGGINCEIPVSKTGSPNPANAGDDVTFTIRIPTDAEALRPFPCELTNISVVDQVQIESGSPSFTVVSGTGPNGEVGTVSGNTVTFNNIGSYKVGDPSLEVKVVIRLNANSKAGRLRDVATVTATPGNCRGNADFFGTGLVGGGFFGLNGAFFGADGVRLVGGGLDGTGAGSGALTGVGVLSGPDTGLAAVLPRTGPASDSRTPMAVAALAAAAALVIRRVNRRRTA